MPKTKASAVLTALTTAADFDGRLRTSQRRDPDFMPGDGQTVVDAPLVDFRQCVLKLVVDDGSSQVVDFPIEDALTPGELISLDILLAKLADHAADLAGFYDA